MKIPFDSNNSVFVFIRVKSFESSVKSIVLSPFVGPEGAFKKLKSESTSLGGVGPGGGGGSNSCVGNSHLHNPTAAACPTPARRRHRTTFTQVRDFIVLLALILEKEA